MGDQYQFFQNYKHSLSLADMDSNIDFLNHFLNPNHSDMSTLNSQNLMMGFPQDHTMESLPAGFFIQDHTINPFMSAADHVPMNANMMIMDDHHVDRKRKSTVEISGTTTPESSSANTCAYNSSPQASDNASRKTNRGKKSKSSGIRDEKPGEVIHVRAKRGQATDSHSLAERVRRGKINERLRCLQDIVPGCYKTMGMAVMLDEIINYVQSLQNQVEFLSMKLTAASTFHDFNNSTTSAMDAMQAAKSTFEAALKAENASNQVQGFQQMKINYHPPSNTHPPNHISFLPQ